MLGAGKSSSSAVRNPEALRSYEAECLRGGRTIRQLDRQIATPFYERTALSKNKPAMLRRGEKQQSGDKVTPEEEIVDHQDRVVLARAGRRLHFVGPRRLQAFESVGPITRRRLYLASNDRSGDPRFYPPATALGSAAPR